MSVPIVDDGVPDSGEFFLIGLRNVQGGPADAFFDLGGITRITILNHEEPITAAFSDVPADHTGAAFTVALAFSQAFEVTEAQIRAGLAATGGEVTTVAQAPEGETQNWNVTVTPASSADTVTLTLTPKASCDTENAICIAGVLGLEAAVTARSAWARAAARGERAGDGRCGRQRDLGDGRDRDRRGSRSAARSGSPATRPSPSPSTAHAAPPRSRAAGVRRRPIASPGR